MIHWKPPNDREWQSINKESIVHINQRSKFTQKSSLYLQMQ